MTYEFGGILHEVTREEIDAIERSGPPHDVQHYADGHFGRGYFDITQELMSDTVRLIRSRPGQTRVGKFPIDVRRELSILSDRSAIHLRGYDCGTHSKSPLYFVDDYAFGEALSMSMKVCLHCERKFSEMSHPA